MECDVSRSATNMLMRIKHSDTERWTRTRCHPSQSRVTSICCVISFGTMRCIECIGKTTNRKQSAEMGTLKVKLRARKLTTNLVYATILLKARTRSALDSIPFLACRDFWEHTKHARETFTSMTDDDFRHVASGLHVISANLCLSLVTLHEWLCAPVLTSVNVMAQISPDYLLLVVDMISSKINLQWIFGLDFFWSMDLTSVEICSRIKKISQVLTKSEQLSSAMRTKFFSRDFRFVLSDKCIFFVELNFGFNRSKTSSTLFSVVCVSRSVRKWRVLTLSIDRTGQRTYFIIYEREFGYEMPKYTTMTMK